MVPVESVVDHSGLGEFAAGQFHQFTEIGLRNSEIRGECNRRGEIFAHRPVASRGAVLSFSAVVTQTAKRLNHFKNQGVEFHGERTRTSPVNAPALSVLNVNLYE